MIRGQKPKPSALRQRRVGNDGPVPPDALPRCPPHLDAVARKEWRRIATPLYRMGVLTVADRATLAAYCQAYSRWVEAETKLAETPMLIKAPSGYVQQSPWLSIANRQMELMCRFAVEMGLTPSSRTRVAVSPAVAGDDWPTVIEFRTVHASRSEDDAARGARPRDVVDVTPERDDMP